MAVVLVVEDNPTTAVLLRRMLQRQGHETIVASTATEALAVADASGEAGRPPLDLVTMDMFLPDGDGLAICGIFRAEHGLPVILVSAIGEDLGELLLEAPFGPLAFVSKPVDPARLVAAVEHALAPSGVVPEQG